MKRDHTDNQQTVHQASTNRLKAGEDLTNEAGLPPLSDADRRRLLRAWTDANTLGDDEARRRVEDEILGRPTKRPKDPNTP